MCDGRSGILALALAAALSTSCASEQPASIPSASAGPSEPATWPSGDQIELAIEVRKLFGLRADQAFVEFLFSDAESVRRGEQSRFGIPLTAPELQQLETLENALDATIAAVERYAETVPDAWGGLYIDRVTNEVVAQFTAPLADHAAALEPLITAHAPLRLKEVEYAFAELDGLYERMKADVDIEWYGEIDASLLSLDADEVSNRVQLIVRSTRPDIEEVIRARYGHSPMLEIEVDTRPEWTGGRGTLVVIATYEDGSPVRNHECSLVPDEPEAWGEDVRVTGDTGRCTFRNVGATNVQVVLIDFINDRVKVAAKRATVVDGQTITVRITIRAVPSQPPG